MDGVDRSDDNFPSAAAGGYIKASIGADRSVMSRVKSSLAAAGDEIWKFEQTSSSQ